MRRLCNNPNCEVYFNQTNTQHRYCGSAKLKIGCSYKNRLNLNKRYKESNNRYIRKWRERNKERINEKRRTIEYHNKVRLHKQIMAEKFMKIRGFIPKRDKLTYKELAKSY